jgi:hypothetical protein
MNLNHVLASCGDDGVFEYLLYCFSSMKTMAQETLGFAIVALGGPWVARFQEVAFRSTGATHHHQLAKAVALEIDDATARCWIANGFSEPGWRVLIARHGGAIVPEMVASLPESFEGLDYIPTLAAMRYLVNPPESLRDEIWRRVRGTMRPRTTEDAIAYSDEVVRVHRSHAARRFNLMAPTILI